MRIRAHLLSLHLFSFSFFFFSFSLFSSFFFLSFSLFSFFFFFSSPSRLTPRPSLSPPLSRRKASRPRTAAVRPPCGSPPVPVDSSPSGAPPHQNPPPSGRPFGRKSPSKPARVLLRSAAVAPPPAIISSPLHHRSLAVLTYLFPASNDHRNSSHELAFLFGKSGLSPAFSPPPTANHHFQ
ncbi:hypothetical protein I3760_13G144900 [Carya illinoinensis]|nr:hypothetical protein I3760_13G144900 [Carya illinoinensis]